MREITGDLLDPEHGFAAIGHGVNCRGVMGAGIAAAVHDLYPERMFTEYAGFCRDGRMTPGVVWPYVSSDPTLPVLLNLATQDEPGPTATIDAVWACVSKALALCWSRGIDALALPEIGCGIGGLEWESPDRAAEPDPRRYVGDLLWTLDAASPVDIVVVHFDG